MTYIDKYTIMPTEDLCDWADALFKRAIDEDARGDPRMTEVRNILPFVVDRLRAATRTHMTSAQKDLMNQADRMVRRGRVGEAFKLRMQAADLDRPNRINDPAPR